MKSTGVGYMLAQRRRRRCTCTALRRCTCPRPKTYLRIGVARAARKHPVILPMLQDGRLHLSGIAKLAPVLTEANCDDLLARAKHKTKRKIEELVAEVAPKPDVPSTMRKLPAPRKPSKPVPMVELRPDAVETPTQPKPAPSPRPAPVKPAVVEPLAPCCLSL